MGCGVGAGGWGWGWGWGERWGLGRRAGYSHARDGQHHVHWHTMSEIGFRISRLEI